MAIGDHFRLAFVGSLNGQLTVNVFHYRQSSANATADSDAKQLAKAFDAGVVPSLIAAMSSDWLGYVIESRTFPIPPTPPSGYDLNNAQAGDEEQTAMPPSVAAVVRRKTAFLGRKYRGRIFIPAVPQGWVIDGSIGGATPLTRYGAVATAMAAALTSADAGAPTFIPEIAAYTRDVTGAIDGIRHNDVTTAALDKPVRSQRRREIGRGS